jgi:polysaccharide export outer membrane protein
MELGTVGGREMRKSVSQVLGLVGIVLFVNLYLSANAAQQEQSGTEGKPVNLLSASADGDVHRPAAAERNPRYRICRDDVLSLSFALSPELNQRVTVQPDGFISLQGAGDLYVQGLTVRELVEAVKKAYAGKLHDPIIDVDLVDFQKPFFTVFGEVGKPGQYNLRNDITVTQAIAVAGGFTPTAKTQVFLYRAVSANWAEVRELKLKDLLNGKNISEDVHVRAGDMIFVPEKFIAKFKKYVPYSFAFASPYPTTF